jgi:predicted MPP superfamily phosphohydrolase
MRRFILVILSLILGSNLICWLAVDSILYRLAAADCLYWSFGAFFLFQIVGFVAIIGGRMLGYQPGTGIGRPLLSLFMIWNLLLALPAAVIYAIWAVIAWMTASAPARDGANPGLHMAALTGLALFPVMAVIATAVAVWQVQRFRVNRVTLTIPNLPAPLKGLSIVHLSDLHIGKLTRGKVLEDMVAATNKLDADLILVTGDLINMSLEDLPHGLDLLRRMKSRHGLFLCEGNHDLIENEAGFEAAAKQSGLGFLLNENAVISYHGQRIQILGLRWGEDLGRSQEAVGAVAGDALDRLLSQREPGDFVILLAHHPDAFDAAARAGIPLTLAGHTHGGQLMLTPKVGFGPWLYRYWSGLYRLGESQMIVSNGAGNWFPLRIGAPAEIIHITLN